MFSLISTISTGCEQLRKFQGSASEVVAESDLLGLRVARRARGTFDADSGVHVRPYESREEDMKLRKELAFCTALAALFFAGCAIDQPKPGSPNTIAVGLSSGRTISKDLADVERALAEVGSIRTLLVLDIDDTLLTSPVFFGSDAWYEWQRSPLTTAAQKVPCLFDVIAINTELGTQVATQPNASALINVLLPRQDTIILTSRNPSTRGATLRELQAAGYALPRPLAGQTDGVAYRFRKDAASRMVTVTYDQGIFMTEGQDKGLVLLDLLERLRLRYERVVLVDDGERNHINMENALKSRGIESRGLHYTKVDKEADSGEQTAAESSWREMTQMLERVFPERASRLKAGQCTG